LCGACRGARWPDRARLQCRAQAGAKARRCSP
jgi:hypothetical protein